MSDFSFVFVSKPCTIWFGFADIYADNSHLFNTPLVHAVSFSTEKGCGLNIMSNSVKKGAKLSRALGKRALKSFHPL